MKPLLCLLIFSCMLSSLKLLSVKIYNKGKEENRNSLWQHLGTLKLRNPHPSCYTSPKQHIPWHPFKWPELYPSLPLIYPSAGPAGEHHFPPCPLSSIFHFRCLSRLQKMKLSASPRTEVLYGISSPVCHSSLNPYPLHSHPDLCK